MRILAIRGQNLASLAERFEIDLATGPIAGTGLFAITGDTGAGKSTILDALCLGLYGDYPRTRGKGAEKIRDPSDDDVQASDARNILRRGAGEGFAEVDFVGSDGLRYRSMWTVRRARARATGRLQRAERKLDCLDTGANVAVGLSEVEAAVERHTGLTFDQFRRTVLLAQGEFDAFLAASDSERADLLEKITGTEVYTRISKRVYEEWSRRMRDLDERRQARDRISVLSAEERIALLERRSGVAAESARLAAEIRSIAETVARADQIAAARSNLADAETTLEDASSAWDAFAPSRELLAAVAAAEPLRAVITRFDQSREDALDCETTRDRAGRARDEARGSLEQAERAAQEQGAEARAREAAVARFEPEWRAATALDHQTASAKDEWAAAARDEKTAAANVETIGTEAAGLARDLASTRARAAAALAALDASAPHKRLLDERGFINDLLDRREALQGRLAGEIASRDRAAEHIRAAETRIGVVQKAIVANRADIARLASDLAAARDAVARIGLAALTERDADLSEIERLTSSASVAVRRRERARHALREARERASDANARRDPASRELAEAERQHAAITVARREFAHLADLAEATASEQAEHLRSHLAAGEPCPVCGGTEHPYALAGAAVGLVNEIRQRRAALDQSLDRTAAAIRASTSVIATTEAQAAQAEATAVAAETDIAAAIGELAEILPAIRQSAGALGIDGILEQSDPATIAPDALSSLADTVAGARAEVARKRRSGAEQQRAADDLTERLTRAGAELEALEQETKSDQDALAASRETLSAVSARCRALDEQIAELSAALTPYLACAGLSAADLADDGARRTLDRLATDYEVRLAGQTALTRELAEIERALRETSARLQAATEARDRLRLATAKRAETLNQLAVRRRELLGGELTDEHRTRVVAALDAATSAAREAADVATGAKLACERRQAEFTSRSEAATVAAAKLEQARSELAKALADTGTQKADARALLAMPMEERKSLAAELERLRRALEAAQTTCANRRDDVASLAAGTSDLDAGGLDELRSRKTDLESDRDRLTAEMALVRERMDRDEAARQEAEAASAEIARVEHEVDVWSHVSEAIGQADGAKFRRFAQGITLRRLVEIANAQLAALNPRYALRPGAASELTLEIVDREMGDEPRSARSLSGGERFLVSLALALALSGLEGGQSFVDTLFIDEGFGSLDRDTLDMAIDALEALHSQGRKVGVITHVSAMMERIAVQVRVEKRGGGRSAVRLRDSGGSVLPPI